MSVYNDSIYDGLNEAGNDAWKGLIWGRGLNLAIGKAIRAGSTPFELLGQAAEKITAVVNCTQSPPLRDSSWFSIISEWALDQLERGVPGPEVIGFVLSSVMEEATQVSLHLRFENKNYH